MYTSLFCVTVTILSHPEASKKALRHRRLASAPPAYDTFEVCPTHRLPMKPLKHLPAWKH